MAIPSTAEGTDLNTGVFMECKNRAILNPIQCKYHVHWFWPLATHPDVDFELLDCYYASPPRGKYVVQSRVQLGFPVLKRWRYRILNKVATQERYAMDQCDTGKAAREYQNATYWFSIHARFQGSLDAGGYAGYGEPFNRETYKLRLKALNRPLRRTEITRSGALLEAAVGVGAYGHCGRITCAIGL